MVNIGIGNNNKGWISLHKYIFCAFLSSYVWLSSIITRDDDDDNHWCEENALKYEGYSPHRTGQYSTTHPSAI